MNAITKRMFICLAFLYPCSTAAWTFSDMISDATSSVASYFNKKETESSAQEYAMGLHAPITLTNLTGAIKVTTWNKPAMLLQAVKRGSEEDIKNTSFTVTIKDDAVTITTQLQGAHKNPATIDYTLTIPRTAPLTVRTDAGNISLYESHANIDLQTHNGSIKIEQATKSVRAQAHHGDITIEQRALHGDGSIFAQADRTIALILPENSNAQLHANAPHGKINSDIYITLDPITTKLDKDSYKRLQHSIKGSMGAGGMPITLESTHGSINILGT